MLGMKSCCLNQPVITFWGLISPHNIESFFVLSQEGRTGKKRKCLNKVKYIQMPTRRGGWKSQLCRLLVQYENWMVSLDILWHCSAMVLQLSGLLPQCVSGCGKPNVILTVEIFLINSHNWTTMAWQTPYCDKNQRLGDKFGQWKYFHGGN